ncbi:MAG: FTR1 family protein, partial [Candidatus Dormibacteraceae bacterium]
MLTSAPRPIGWSRQQLGNILLWAAGAVVAGTLLWIAFYYGGKVPDPTTDHLSRGAAMLDSGILVFREGLEVILVLAAVTASMVGKVPYRGPVAAGSGLALLATVATWFGVVALIGVVNAPELDIQAVTGMLAVAVLLVVMNWFLHKIYWTGWISHHRRRQQKLTQDLSGRPSRMTLGLVLLGFTAM